MGLIGKVFAGLKWRDVDTTNTAGSGAAVPVELGLAGLEIGEGSGANQCERGWSQVVSLAVSTPQTLDLQTLTGPLGSSVNFNGVRVIRLHNRSAVTTAKVTVGAAASNPFLPGLDGTNPTFEVPAGSTVILTNMISASGWSVSGSLRYLKLDPGTTAQDIEVCIGGLIP